MILIALIQTELMEEGFSLEFDSFLNLRNEAEYKSLAQLRAIQEPNSYVI